MENFCSLLNSLFDFELNVVENFRMNGYLIHVFKISQISTIWQNLIVFDFQRSLVSDCRVNGIPTVNQHVNTF